MTHARWAARGAECARIASAATAPCSQAGRAHAGRGGRNTTVPSPGRAGLYRHSAGTHSRPPGTLAGTKAASLFRRNRLNHLRWGGTIGTEIRALSLSFSSWIRRKKKRAGSASLSSLSSLRRTGLSWSCGTCTGPQPSKQQIAPKWGGSDGARPEIASAERAGRSAHPPRPPRCEPYVDPVRDLRWRALTQGKGCRVCPSAAPTLLP